MLGSGVLRLLAEAARFRPALPTPALGPKRCVLAALGVPDFAERRPPWCDQWLYIRTLLAAAKSDAALGEKLLSFAGKFVFCGQLLVSRHDETLRNKLLKNLPLFYVQIRAPSF